MDIQQEINRHLEWIETVVSMLGDENVTQADLDQVTQHDRCALGQWLNSEESLKFKDLPELEELRQSHDAFHRLAGDLIKAVQEKNETVAVESEQHFVEMSQKVITYLQVLQEHAEKHSKD